ncbi:hypothetical protein Rctr71_071 [Virus Rctr71]|nr:hypothetical protein Rctr71_071 [Virus Rctr71]
MGFLWDLIVVIASVIFILMVVITLWWRKADIEEGNDDPIGDFIKKAVEKMGGSK